MAPQPGWQYYVTCNDVLDFQNKGSALKLAVIHNLNYLCLVTWVTSAYISRNKLLFILADKWDANLDPQRESQMYVPANQLTTPWPQILVLYTTALEGCFKKWHKKADYSVKFRSTGPLTRLLYLLRYEWRRTVSVELQTTL